MITESEDSTELKKVTLHINSVGGVISDKNKQFFDTFKDLETRVEEAEESFEDIIEMLMEAPANKINIRNLRIFVTPPLFFQNFLSHGISVIRFMGYDIQT